MAEHLFPVEVKLVSAKTGVIEGYASTFDDDPDSHGDVVERGAFAASLTKHRSIDTMPAMLWAHDPNQPIGKWLSLKEDGHGLAVSGKLTLGTEKGREALALATDGALSFSIGYVTKSAGRNRAGNRILKVVDLHEISLVSMPSKTSARIMSVKSTDDMSPRDFSRFLHDNGFSRSLATAITAVGFTKAMERRGRTDHSDAIKSIRASAAALRSLTTKG